jgi:hypothetical protein
MAFAPVNYEPFVLWLVMTKEHQEQCLQANLVPMELVNPGRRYLGFRERPLEAITRAQQYEIEVTSERCVFLKVTISPLGFFHYANKKIVAYRFHAPVLSKKVYWKSGYDWKTWQFLEDLPLDKHTPSGEMLVSTEWFDVPNTPA